MVACITESNMGFLILIATFIGLGMSQSNMGLSTGSQTQSTSPSSSGFQPQTTTLSPNDCTFFSSNSPCYVPQRDFEKFCLSNGSIIVGFCRTNEFLCSNKNLNKGIVLSPLSSCSLSTTTSNGMFPGAGGMSFKTGTTDKYGNHYKKNVAHSNLQSALLSLVLTCLFACAAHFIY